MKRLANVLMFAATAIACGGCVAPVVLKSVGPFEPALPLEAEHLVVVKRVEKAVEHIDADPEIIPIEPVRVAFQPVAPEASHGESEEHWTLKRAKPLREISLDITAPKLTTDQQLTVALPKDYAAEALPVMAQEQPFTRGALADSGLEWHPSPAGLTYCHQPLYFEEVNLERYGRSWGVLQPAISVAKFYGRIPALPYMVFAQPARRCTDHAHWSLPGYKIPVGEHQPLIPSIHGGAAEVAVLYGIILLVP